VNPEALNARIFADRLPTHLDRAIRPFWPWPKSGKYGFQLLVLLDVATYAPQQLRGLAVGVADDRNAKARISPQSPKHIGNGQNLTFPRLQKTPETEPIVRLKQFDPLLVMQTQSDRLAILFISQTEFEENPEMISCECDPLFSRSRESEANRINGWYRW